RLRYWDEVTDAWVDLATPLTTGWQTLGISYDGDSFNYLYNGVQIASVPVTTAQPASDLKVVMVQAYAFGGDNADYEVLWDNISVTDVAVPEPAALSLVGLGALGLLRRKRR